MDFDSLVSLMRENGLVGCGGAGFPSYAKLAKGLDTLIINCAECEPLLRLHRQLMERKTREILTAIKVVAETLNIKNVYIGLKKVYVNTIDALNRVLPEFPFIQLALLNEVYPAGDEVVLVYEVTKRRIEAGKLPSSVGCLVYNTETMYNLYRALNGKKVTHKYVTITGEVNEPHTFYAPIGSLIWGLVKRSGGSKIEDPAFLIGGPMMGRLGSDQEVVTKTTNAVIVLPKDHPVVLRKKEQVRLDVKKAMAACCQCSYCTDMCPRHLLGHPIDPAEIMRVVSNSDLNNPKAYLGAQFCSGCGVCEMYACHQGLSPRTIISSIKKTLAKNGVRETNPITKDVVIDRELKRVPLKRLGARLDLDQYKHQASIYLDPINAKEVDIPLNQHIGVPAMPVVKVNDVVHEGELIAKAIDDKLSINYHASIDGTIMEVNDKVIKIKTLGGSR